MIQIKFKNLKKSKMIQDAVHGRVEDLVVKFPDLSKSKILVTLEMENSPAQAGPDLFSVKIHVSNHRYDGVTIQKEDSNLYIALADVIDHMLEVLNRFGDKVRVKERKKARELNKEIENFINFEVKKSG